MATLVSGRADGTRKLLAIALLAYAAFAIYGSLVPLNFRALPLAAAWDEFRAIRYLKLGIGSRADWVANILLFVPLAFFALGTFWPSRGRLRRLLVSAGMLAGCAGLSIAIEFTQVFFPARTVSLNDIFAECIGASLGVAAWWAFGDRFKAWLQRWRQINDQGGAALHLLHVYLFVLFGYSVLPLDLTISPAELFQKWRLGRVQLVPFLGAEPFSAELVYELLTDAAIWVPAAFLWRLATGHSARRTVLFTAVAAFVLECLQLFVWSRVSDATDIVTAALGAAMGAGIAGAFIQRRHLVHSSHQEDQTILGWKAMLWGVALLSWTAVLVAVFWYPYDFRTDWGFVHAQVAKLKRVPFALYYSGTEFRAVTEVLHKVGFFLPLGILLAIGTRHLMKATHVAHAVWHSLALCFVAGAAAGIELGQVFLPNKHPDVTDWTLACLGGIAGYIGSLRLAPRLASPSTRTQTAWRRKPASEDRPVLS